MDTPIFLMLLLIFYVVVLLILKNSGYKRKISCAICSNCCPSCNSPLERVKRKQADRLLNFFTFHLFNFKRYTCNNCDWNGIRWEKEFRKQSSH